MYTSVVQGIPKKLSDFKRRFDVSKLMQSNVVLLTMANLCPWDVATALRPSLTLPLNDATLRATCYNNNWHEPTVGIRKQPLKTSFNWFESTVATASSM